MRRAVALSPIVIAGGGLAGSSAACRLAASGRKVILLERDHGPAHKVCGEFLSGGALSSLAELGLDAERFGASRITAMRLVHRGRIAESRLPFTAAGLSRFVLDEALLRRAVGLGVDVQRGVRVRSAERGEVQTDGGVIPFETLLLATGKHDLRGLARTVLSPPEALIGFKLHLRLRVEQRAALAGHVEIVLFKGGYAGLQMIEGEMTNLCLLVERARFEQQGHLWSTLLASLEREDSHLARRLDGALATWERPLSIFRVPYGFVHQGPEQEGVYRLGDQAAVIPSFCGDGMAIALHSARLAAEAVLARRNAMTYHHAIRRDAGPSVRLAFGLYRLSRSPAIRRAIVEISRGWPGLMSAVARRTRVAAV